MSSPRSFTDMPFPHRPEYYPNNATSLIPTKSIVLKNENKNLRIVKGL